MSSNLIDATHLLCRQTMRIFCTPPEKSMGMFQELGCMGPVTLLSYVLDFFDFCIFLVLVYFYIFKKIKLN
jgi:hypothetical protein